MSHPIELRSRWAKRVGPWFVHQWPRNRNEQKLLSASFIDAVLGDVNDISVRVSTHPFPAMDGRIWRNAKVHESYSYQFEDTDHKIYLGRRFLDQFGPRNRKELFIGFEVIDRVLEYQPFGSLPLLQWYEGEFDAAYVALHPFSSDTYKAIGAERFTWEQLKQELQLPDITWITRYLTSPGIPYYDKDTSKELNEHRLMQDEMYPAEGEFGFEILTAIVAILEERNIERVFVASHGREKFEELFVWQLRERVYSGNEDDIVSISQVTPADRSFTIGVGNGRPYSVISGKSEVLASIELDQYFEGFMANEHTTDQWWLTESERTRIVKQQAREGYRFTGRIALDHLFY